MSGNVILVTSAGSLTAANICEQLFTLKQKFVVRAGDRNQDRLNALKKKMGKRADDGSFETVVFDFSRPETIEKALKNVRRVVLYLPNTPQREQYARNMIDACRRLSPPPEQLVLLSVIGAKQMETTLLKQFNSIEDHLRQSGQPFTILSSALYQEVITHFYADQIARGELHLPVKEDGKFALVSVREIAHAVPRVIDDMGRTLGQQFIFTGPELFVGKDIAHQITDVIQKEVKFHSVDIDKAVTHLVSVGWKREQATEMMEFLHWMSHKGKMENPAHDAEKLGVHTVKFREILTMDRQYLVKGENRTDPL